MPSTPSIHSRFRQIREHLGQSQTQMAATLGIAQSTLSQLESGHSSPSFDALCRLAERCEVDLNWLVTGRGSLPGTGRAPANGTLNVALVDTGARAGYVDSGGSAPYVGTLDRYRIPGFEDDDDLRLFEVDGNSMLPTFSSGDHVVCRRVDGLSELPSNTLAVVVTDEAVLLKRISLVGGPAGGALLRSDNPAFETRIVAHEHLRELWRVECKLTRQIDDVVALHARKLDSLERDLAALRDQVGAMLEARHHDVDGDHHHDDGSSGSSSNDAPDA